MPACTLCGLPAGGDPVTDPSVDGHFCCPGCLAVHRELGDLDSDGPDGSPSGRRGPGVASDHRTPEDPGTPTVPERAETAYLAVSGMHCTTCEAFLERLGERTDGVYSVDASYAAETLRVTYDPDEVARGDLHGRLSRWGYEARDRGDAADADDHEAVGRLLVGGFFAMMAMVLYGLFVYPQYLGVDPIVDLGPFAGRYVFGHLLVFASVVLFYTGWPVLRGALVSLRARRPNVDLLVSIAAVAAYLYSTGTVVAGGTDPYFDVSIVIVLAVSVGRHYEGRIRRRAAGALADLAGLRVREARRAADGSRVPVDEVRGGDELLVRPGERIPVDGTVLEGSAAVDEALVTGEAVPRAVEPGEPVRGGTVVHDAPVTVAAAEGAESTLDRLVETLWEVQSTRPGAQRLADRLATAFVPLVLSLAGVATLWSIATGAPLEAALLTGLGVLVVSCPCALGLATPLAVAAGISAAADRGVVVATPALFEHGAAVDTVVLDKTGTLTDGEMQVGDVWCLDGAASETVCHRASALERLSGHPVAEAVAAAGDGAIADVEDFERAPRGVAGVVDGERTFAGHPEFCREQGLDLSPECEALVGEARERGEVPVVVGWAGRARGVFAVGDRPRPGWQSVLDALAEDHRLIVLSGDEAAATARFADHPAVDEVYAGVPPEGKAATVRRLGERGSVAMVGDGSNDAPALGAADVGVALGGGTQLAGDAADAVVAGDDLAAVPAVFDVAAATRRRIRGNLGWALCYNLVAIPLAVAGLINPLFAALAMAASSLLVVANSSRPIASRSARASASRAETAARTDSTPAAPPADRQPEPTVP